MEYQPGRTFVIIKKFQNHLYYPQYFIILEKREVTPFTERRWTPWQEKQESAIRILRQ